MKRKKKFRLFPIVNAVILLTLALLCVIPLIHVAAVSLSSSAAAAAGRVVLWPKEFTWNSYAFVAKRPAFWQSMLVSLLRIVLGGSISMLLTVLAAYPLSYSRRELSFRNIYAWFFFITMIFNAGLIPWYMVIRQFGLLNTIWALVLPGAVPVFNVILLLNFFREVPKELAEAAFIDGASHWKTLWSIYVPLSKPALATLLLFSLVGNWNSWFDGLILMNDPGHYPLQTYIQTIAIQRNFSMMTREEIMQMATISDRTLRCAQIFLGSLPIVMVYPFLQKYFVKGIVLGGVKG